MNCQKHFAARHSINRSVETCADDEACAYIHPPNNRFGLAAVPVYAKAKASDPFARSAAVIKKWQEEIELMWIAAHYNISGNGISENRVTELEAGITYRYNKAANHWLTNYMNILSQTFQTTTAAAFNIVQFPITRVKVAAKKHAISKHSGVIVAIVASAVVVVALGVGLSLRSKMCRRRPPDYTQIDIQSRM